MHVVWSVLVLLVVTVAACAPAQREQLSMGELLGILEIRTWRVPLPDNEKQQWTIAVVESAPVNPSGRNVFDAIPSTGEGLISLRDKGNGQYRFTLKQNRGQSAGELHLAPCPSDMMSCGGMSITWHEIPVCRFTCEEFVLADVKPMIGSGRDQQIIISAVPLK